MTERDTERRDRNGDARRDFIIIVHQYIRISDREKERDSERQMLEETILILFISSLHQDIRGVSVPVSVPGRMSLSLSSR